jgi:hypothetical protein
MMVDPSCFYECWGNIKLVFIIRPTSIIFCLRIQYKETGKAKRAKEDLNFKEICKWWGVKGKGGNCHGGIQGTDCKGVKGGGMAKRNIRIYKSGDVGGRELTGKEECVEISQEA